MSTLHFATYAAMKKASKAAVMHADRIYVAGKLVKNRDGTL